MADPFWRHDGLAPHLVKGDVLGRVAGRGGDGRRGEHPLWRERRPLQHLHAPHGAAHHAKQGVDPQMIDQHHLGPGHVGDGDHRKVEPVRRPGRGIGGAWPRRSHAAAQNIRADHEIAVRIDGLSGAHALGPPARLAGHGIGVRHILVHGQRVTDQDRVGFFRVKPPIGGVGDLHRRQLRPRRQPKGRIAAKDLGGGVRRLIGQRRHIGHL